MSKADEMLRNLGYEFDKTWSNEKYITYKNNLMIIQIWEQKQ